MWVNWKFQIWGNDPNLGQKLIFKFEIQWESNSSLSHNYSRTWPKHSRIFICASLTKTIRYHRNITKKHVLDNKNFSKYGRLTQIWSNFLWGNFHPNLEQFSNYWDTSTTWGKNKTYILISSFSHWGESSLKNKKIWENSKLKNLKVRSGM